MANTKHVEPPITVRDFLTRIVLILCASIVMAMNLKSFVQAGGMFPGGFNGLTLLIQRSAQQFAGVTLPFTLVNFILNAIPAVISFRFIGKRFTLFSCLCIVVTSVLTDILPAFPVTNDLLLISIFGGIINGFAISLCLLGRATSGGTDFIAVAVSERLHVDAWNYVLAGNAVMLVVAGVLFGWDKALYSIIFQFASTQIVHRINPRYKRATLMIITAHADEVYEAIKQRTHHSATLFHGKGLYNGKEQDMIYSVIEGAQVKAITHLVRSIDPKAFLNIMKTDHVVGKFYEVPND
jgi:uncharacterized membrane-anchored protein YitT (DUF2179 family)